MNAHILTLGLCLFGCGGMPLPTPDAVTCSPRLYIQPGSGMTCTAALAARDDASRETGADLADVTIEFMRGSDLSELGYPHAWGRTQGDTVAVVGSVAVSLVHEALHVRFGANHCNWSQWAVPILEAHHVPGEFYDECRHVTCTSTHYWFGTWQGTTQMFGDTYTCS